MTALLAILAAGALADAAVLFESCGVYELVGVPRCDGGTCSRVVVSQGTESETVLSLKRAPPNLLLYKGQKAALRVKVTGLPGPYRAEAEILSIDGIARAKGPPGARDPLARVEAAACRP